ncbi:His-Xaa-Ser system protein HxsD [Aggregicoccus sp. 17bor-14]|uniref:His-Xaa-Ser system protein HxsD n=1 Tax=Myxococcaceae TaxID=31 RepID=UPI00129C86C4|nr:His-Xaa-Ser system protein HxsD [Simulacricoccus sp. 17bor-14]MRI89068.1 His-Xaa-Ser system protein HxsD [Aggregicoccus sp. 17bor-14]
MTNAVATVEFDRRVYRLEAVKKAAYRLSAQCVSQIELGSGDEVYVTLTLKQPGSLDDLVVAFRTEVLDQELREVVAKETEAVRNLILAQAFSKTALLDPVGESGDFREDPLGIGKPDPRAR